MSHSFSYRVILAAACALAVSFEPARAALVVYSAFDVGQATPIGPNSLAEEEAFLAAAGSVNKITFETALPSGVSLGGTGFVDSQPVSNFRLYGANTTPGGANFLNLPASYSTATLTFSTPTSVFGAYFSGPQLDDDLITFNDGAPQSIALPYDYVGGGMAFVGFTDFGAAITSVKITVSHDLIGVDDVLYSAGLTAAPEPSTWALMLAGFVGLAFAGSRTSRGRAFPAG